MYQTLIFWQDVANSKDARRVKRRSSQKRAQKFLACVARISMRFPSKEQGPMKNEASKRAGRGWGRKERNACTQTQGFSKPANWRAMPECTHRHLMLSSTVIYWPIKRLASVERKWTFEDGGNESERSMEVCNCSFKVKFVNFIQAIFLQQIFLIGLQGSTATSFPSRIMCLSTLQFRSEGRVQGRSSVRQTYG